MVDPVALSPSFSLLLPRRSTRLVAGGEVAASSGVRREKVSAVAFRWVDALASPRAHGSERYEVIRYTRNVHFVTRTHMHEHKQRGKEKGRISCEEEEGAEG